MASIHPDVLTLERQAEHPLVSGSLGNHGQSNLGFGQSATLAPALHVIEYPSRMLPTGEYHRYRHVT